MLKKRIKPNKKYETINGAISQAVGYYFGEKIKGIRKGMGLTQKEIGTQLGVTRQRIEQIENGVKLGDIDRFRISLGTIYRICMILGKEPREVLPSIAELEGPNSSLVVKKLERWSVEDKEKIKST